LVAAVSTKWNIVGAYSGAQLKWYLASVLPVSSTATDTATSTLDIAQVSAGQETIYRDGMGAEIPPGPDRVYNRLVFDYQYFAKTHAMLVEHPWVLNEYMQCVNRPMTEIVVLGGDLGISTATNPSGGTELLKR
jgi:hypothetical protein